MLACRQLHLELLDEGGHILVADDGTLVLLHAEDALVDMYLQVALHLTLASKTPSSLYLLTGEVWLLGVEYLATALEHLHLALTARGLTSTGAWQKDTILIECRHQAVALWHVDGAVAIDLYVHISAG